MARFVTSTAVLFLHAAFEEGWVTCIQAAYPAFRQREEGHLTEGDIQSRRIMDPTLRHD